MSKTLDQLTAGLKQLDTVDAVWRQHNSYAKNKNGDIIAFSLTGSEVESIVLDEKAAALEYLYLAGNEGLKEVVWKEKTPRLVHLNLSECALESLEIPAGCESIRQVYVKKNRLNSLILKGDYPVLQLLDASDNELEEILLPEQAKGLAFLYLNNNRLTSLSFSTDYPLLNSLCLNENQIQSVSTPEGLPALETVYLAKNQISDLGFLEKSPVLLNADLSKNSITGLEPLRAVMEKGGPVNWEEAPGISVGENPLISPPPEIVQQGTAAILNFFREREEQGTDTLYEAKLLLVGEGGAGKTSLCRRLFFPELPLPEEKESTKGIDIHKYEFPVDTPRGRKNFRINIWDFGGQQIYHATHQFFLTKRSLYILLDDTKKDYKNIQDEGFKYWFEVIELLGENSPVLIFQNEKAGRSKAIDFPGIKKQFGNVMDLFRGNLELPGAADKIRDAIFFYIRQLPHIGEPLPKMWILIRGEVEILAMQEPFIQEDRYFEIYGKYLEFDRKKALRLSRYLHDLGVFLHFQDDELLADTVILQNSWATEAVFKILDDEKVKANWGHFTADDCQRIWADSVYSRMHTRLRALMMKFELCYLLADTRPDTWLAPQMLQPSKPEEFNAWERPGDLELRYHYDFMPKGLINRLMVRKHRFVKRPELSWKNGVLFERGDNHLLAQVSEKGDEITLRARGTERKELLSILSDELEALNESFPGLPERVVKKIPCNCSKCVNSTSPEFYTYKSLLQRKKDNIPERQCDSSYEMVSVAALLDGFEGFGGTKSKFIHPMYGIEQEAEGLKRTLDLLIEKKNHFQDALAKAYDEDKKFALQKELEGLKKEIETYRNEIGALSRIAAPGSAISSSTGRGQSELQELLGRTAQLSAEIGQLETSIKTGFSDVHNHLDRQDQALLDILSVSREMKDDLLLVFRQLEEGRYTEAQLTEMTNTINGIVAENFSELPDAILQTWKKLNAKSAEYADIKGKFKLKIPIVPAILEFEKEVSWDLRKLAGKMWNDLKSGKVFLKDAQD